MTFFFEWDEGPNGDGKKPGERAPKVPNPKYDGQERGMMVPGPRESETLMTFSLGKTNTAVLIFYTARERERDTEQRKKMTEGNDKIGDK